MPGSLAEKSRLVRGLVSLLRLLNRDETFGSPISGTFKRPIWQKGGNWTRVVGISFTNYLNTISTLEKALKLQVVVGS